MARRRSWEERRQEREGVRDENAEGYRAGMNGEPVPENASPAFRAGHADAVSTKGDEDVEDAASRR
jgi:hypothetical protein